MRPEERPTKIRTLIVDDEPLARSNLAVLLRLDPQIEIVNQCGSGVEALAEIRSAKPDLVFLDVQMPECDGFDVLELLGKDLPPAVVFVTGPSTAPRSESRMAGVCRELWSAWRSRALGRSRS